MIFTYEVNKEAAITEAVTTWLSEIVGFTIWVIENGLIVPGK